MCNDEQFLVHLKLNSLIFLVTLIVLNCSRILQQKKQQKVFQLDKEEREKERQITVKRSHHTKSNDNQ